MARSLHVSIGCHDSLLRHHRRRGVDKSCTKPVSMRASQLSRTFHDQFRLHLLFLSFFLLVYDQSHVFMDVSHFRVICCRYVLSFETKKHHPPLGPGHATASASGP